MKKTINFNITFFLIAINIFVFTPSKIFAGLNEWTSTPQIRIGRVYAHAIDPVTPTTIYAGTYSDVYSYNFKCIRVPRFRLYNPNNGQHHYTTSNNENYTLNDYGWIQEGIAGYVYNGVCSIDSENSAQIYRLCVSLMVYLTLINNK